MTDTAAGDDPADAFPSLDDVEDPTLRAGVRDAWAIALAESGWDDLASVPWLPDEQERLGLPDETLVEHVNDVVELSRSMAEVLGGRRGDVVSTDLVLAGALIHDVSKLLEFAPDSPGGTAYYDLLGHPYAGVHVCESAGLPVELSHVVLSHSRRTAVEPATMEAVLVARADAVAAAAIRSRALDDLRDA
ncbi:HD domain-containing protein [Halorarum salinum]|uniref:HD domain-containing protein n=1 Tax=Halorarum salinum TaxID=2743089 RepID=A0A7D5QM26_9EURY|nr:HD domain-containing protein [Halobaculum salinum]QLG63165.1 HD domain-containing protein [Halobaculum salinum]